MVRQHLKDCILEKMKGYIERNERQIAMMTAQLQVGQPLRARRPAAARCPLTVSNVRAGPVPHPRAVASA